MTLLRAENLHVSLGSKPVLHGIDLAIEPGEFVGLIGPNGAGKSTLLRAMLGLLPCQGSVCIDGKSMATMKAGERALKVTYLAQEREIAWAVPVEMVVGLGRAPHRPGFAAPTEADHAIIAEAMRRMDVADFRHRIATELSGGEKARVLVARALAQDTPLLLADEPTAGLDPSHQIALMQLFGDLAGGGRSVIASLHDLGLAARWCSRLVLIDNGRIIADGAPEAVLTRETLRNVYGLEAHFGMVEGVPLIFPLDLASPPPA